MALPPERYDHFNNWFLNHEYYSKGTPSLKSGTVYLKCILCPFETPVTPQGNYWNIGNFKKYINSSPNCDVNRSHEETIQMETSNGLQVSMTLDFIAFFTFNKTPPKLEHAFLSQLSTHCKLIRFLLLFFHQLRGASGLDSEEIGHSPYIFSSAMITEVSLIIVCTIPDVFLILVANAIQFFHACMCIKEYESSSSNSSSSSSSSASGLSLHSRTRKEPLEQRLNAFINKHAENGMTVYK